MEESSLRRRPTSPAAPYVGGKRQLALTIIRRIEQIPHATYAEPFVGMGGVSWERDRCLPTSPRSRNASAR
jgi:DNA adenine methylase